MWRRPALSAEDPDVRGADALRHLDPLPQVGKLLLLQIRPKGFAHPSNNHREGEDVAVTRASLLAAALLLLAQQVTAQSREPADAQGRAPATSREDDLRSYASFTAGASFGDGGAALASAAGVGFRFSPRVALDVELAHARKLDFTIDLCPPPRVCVIGGQVPVTGRTLSLVPHLAIELLPRQSRVRAYVVAGAGGGHVRQRYFLIPAFAGTTRAEFTRSNLTVALSFGGGAVFRITRRFAVGVDVRSLHLFDDAVDENRHITPAGALSTMRVGSRLRWTF